VKLQVGELFVSSEAGLNMDRVRCIIIVFGLPLKAPGEGFDSVKGISAISSTMITVLSLLIISKQL